jgi:hypothetical protein
MRRGKEGEEGSNVDVVQYIMRYTRGEGEGGSEGYYEVMRL